jgi:hypothetical protein
MVMVKVTPVLTVTTNALHSWLSNALMQNFECETTKAKSARYHALTLELLKM